MRTKKGQQLHDQKVASTALTLGTNWSVVYVDLPYKAKPPQIGDYIPDIYAKQGSNELVIEVETEDSINTPHAKLQAIAFTAWANRSPWRQFRTVVVRA